MASSQAVAIVKQPCNVAELSCEWACLLRMGEAKIHSRRIEVRVSFKEGVCVREARRLCNQNE